MDDRPGADGEDGQAYRARVEQVEQDRLGAERPDPPGVPGRGERADHFVSPIGQLGDEPGADRTAGPDEHDAHDLTPSFPAFACVFAGHISDTWPGGNVTRAELLLIPPAGDRVTRGADAVTRGADAGAL